MPNIINKSLQHIGRNESCGTNFTWIGILILWFKFFNIMYLIIIITPWYVTYNNRSDDNTSSQQGLLFIAVLNCLFFCTLILCDSVFSPISNDENDGNKGQQKIVSHRERKPSNFYLQGFHTIFFLKMKH